jgi:hypothetical protein
MTSIETLRDLCIGSKAPSAFEKNWIPTVPGKAWFPCFRLYSLTEAHFDPDVDSAGFLRK